MSIVRHSIVVVIALSGGDRAGAVNATAPHSVAQLQPVAMQEDLVSRVQHAEREYHHRLARLRRLRELAVQGNNLQRLAALDSLSERLHAARTSRIKQMRARMSPASQRRLDARLTDGRDLKKGVVAGGTDKARRHPRHEAAPEQRALQTNRGEHRHGGERHAAKHQRAEARGHATAERHDLRHRKAQAREHAATDRHDAKHQRAEAREHAVAERHEIKTRRAKAHRHAAAQRHDAKAKRAKDREHDRPARLRKLRPGAHLPTQKEDDASVTAAITRANFDAEFEKLRKEIESDG